jgi:hypothetical protein
MPRPNSLPWMGSADAKMIRAHENIEGIAREINEWFASIKVNIILKTSPVSPLPWLVVYAEDYIPPIRLSVLIGECVHNMRSAIDNLLYLVIGRLGNMFSRKLQFGWFILTSPGRRIRQRRDATGAPTQRPE